VIDLPPRAPIDDAALAAALAPIVPADELAATPQDAAFHAEGDVWTHTKLAMRALVDGDAYAALSPIGRRAVAIATLLHDIGKPATTKRDDAGKLTSRGHSAKGETLARAALWRLGVPFALREHACALVRHHQIPFFAIDKPEAEATRLARSLSLVLRHDWLVAVADADARGRRCTDPADQARIVERCALWREFASELGIVENAQPFASAHTRRAWCESASRAPDVLAHDDTALEVVVMAGLPASGKDTWLRAHRAELPVIALDDLRAELDVDAGDAQGEVIAAARERARGYLRAATSFAWNATNLSRSLRAQLLALFRSYRARTHVVYCEASPAEVVARNRARRDPVPRAALDRMIERWTVPDPSEAHEVTYAVPVSGDELAWPPS
jgi:predicted kinase